MSQNDDPSVSGQAQAEQKKRAKRERVAEKRRKKTRDKHRAQGLEHVRNYRRVGGKFRSKLVTPQSNRFSTDNDSTLDQ